MSLHSLLPLLWLAYASGQGNVCPGSVQPIAVNICVTVSCSCSQQPQQPQQPSCPQSSYCYTPQTPSVGTPMYCCPTMPAGAPCVSQSMCQQPSTACQQNVCQPTQPIQPVVQPPMGGGCGGNGCGQVTVAVAPGQPCPLPFQVCGGGSTCVTTLNLAVCTCPGGQSARGGVCGGGAANNGCPQPNGCGTGVQTGGSYGGIQPNYGVQVPSYGVQPNYGGVQQPYGVQQPISSSNYGSDPCQPPNNCGPSDPCAPPQNCPPSGFQPQIGGFQPQVGGGGGQIGAGDYCGSGSIPCVQGASCTGPGIPLCRCQNGLIRRGKTCLPY